MATIMDPLRSLILGVTLCPVPLIRRCTVCSRLLECDTRYFGCEVYWFNCQSCGPKAGKDTPERGICGGIAPYSNIAKMYVCHFCCHDGEDDPTADIYVNPPRRSRRLQSNVDDPTANTIVNPPRRSRRFPSNDEVIDLTSTPPPSLSPIDPRWSYDDFLSDQEPSPLPNSHLDKA